MVNRGNLFKLKILQRWHMERSQELFYTLQANNKNVHLTSQSPILNGISTWSLTLRGFSLVPTSLMPLFGTLHIVFTAYNIASSKSVAYPSKRIITPYENSKHASMHKLVLCAQE